MALTELQWMIFLVCVGGLKGQIQTVRDGQLNVLSTYMCEDFESQYGVTIHTINEAGDKAADLEFVLESDLTEDWEVISKLDRWNNGVWEEDFFNVHGRLCELALQYVKKSWMIVRNSFSPPVPGSCDAKSGTYKTTGLQFTKADYDSPVVVLGKYRLTVRVFDETPTQKFCQIGEFEVYN